MDDAAYRRLGEERGKVSAGRQLPWGDTAEMELQSRPIVPLGRRTSSMARSSLHLLKGIGYLISTVSVILLATVSWESASQSPVLIACLLGGATTSIVGMFCRWLSYEVEKRQEERQPRATPDRGSPGSSINNPASAAGTPRPAPRSGR
ncbi:MAG: hypothetical protein EOS36_13290 [Mesorhizobium sp.]|uniref:hypothetical protein n=1 Tax=Mesorhizobium sp. TaxID=1871066 RepID=UPI000FE9D770|nr:hypothetical protein [Mesorhizobium sp.]RWD63143.1 MAG: hypothetical protein EOS36_13290 [Mesorhizobium sp.]RWE37058.1 MAG: hypothetical protein EOS79_25260 [Mesorhizobium sp.]